VIIFDGNGEAISFNDDSSPRTDQTGGTKVCINAQVDRGLSLEWFYKLLALFPDFPDEFKSAIVVGKFNDLPVETRAIVWRSLTKVRLHIVDPRPHYREMEDWLRGVLNTDSPLDALRQMDLDRDPRSPLIRNFMRRMVGDSLLYESAPRRAQSLARIMSDPFALAAPELSSRFGNSLEPEPLIGLADFGRPGDRHLVGSIASWSAKASAAFHAALDVVKIPDENDFMMHYDFGRHMRGRMAQELIPAHAFDQGNRAHIRLLQDTRDSVLEELTANDAFYRVIRRPSFPELESKESYYIQAADFAAGIAADLFSKEKLIGVVNRFEYVTYNGERLSRADAEELMRREDSS
jgi:hypothetical protein